MVVAQIGQSGGHLRAGSSVSQRLRQASWMWATEPRQRQGLTKGPSSSRQKRQVGTEVILGLGDRMARGDRVFNFTRSDRQKKIENLAALWLAQHPKPSQHVLPLPRQDLLIPHTPPRGQMPSLQGLLLPCLCQTGTHPVDVSAKAVRDSAG